jgi:hypothetical protein
LFDFKGDLKMKYLFSILFVIFAFQTGCKKEETQANNLMATPGDTFEQLRKGLLNKDPEILWNTLSMKMVSIFEEGKKELLAKPKEEKEKVAKEGMVSVEDIEKMDTKGFFKFYFGLTKREVYKINTPDIIDQKMNEIANAKVTDIKYEDGSSKTATKARVEYKMFDQIFSCKMAKENDEWHLDSTDKIQ